jgi:hypothetical protein
MRRVVVNFTDGGDKVFTEVVNTKQNGETLLIINDYGRSFLVVLRNVKFIEEFNNG